MDLREPDLRAIAEFARSRSGMSVTLWTLVLTAGAALAGCDPTYSSGGGGGGGGVGGWGSGPGGGGGSDGFGCEQDSDCGGGTTVCARDGECLDSSQVVEVHVSWTISGAPASSATCSSSPDLQLSFLSDDGNEDGEFGFAPVPCVEGKFTIDKLPSWYTEVQLSRDNDDDPGATARIDGSGNAAIDLPY